MIEIEKLKVGDTVWSVSNSGWDSWEGINRVKERIIVKITAKTIKTTLKDSSYVSTTQSCDFDVLFHDEAGALEFVADALDEKIRRLRQSVDDTVKKLNAVIARQNEVVRP